ncbi:hypothetical protein EOPP23_18740 [Endozoicomonas sp. OPT23]|uniref:hypothetical protein n=1 Tax=Endozoicomonas sp. OPT23 TaxID=2072845 RepID=UPI00129BA9F0|nr:hypothetical protein [Endozoicomonas sp. OPT23]MRI35017.1 hypothetical protein [Endozoicomonas sp. OPT23]
MNPSRTLLHTLLPAIALAISLAAASDEEIQDIPLAVSPKSLEILLNEGNHLSFIGELELLVVLETLGLDVYDTDKKEEGEILFFAIEQKKMEAVHLLMQDYIDEHPNRDLTRLRSREGRNLTEALTTYASNEIKTAMLLKHYRLIESPEDIKDKSSIAYMILSNDKDFAKKQ